MIESNKKGKVKIMKGKMINCKVCNAQIAKSAKTCPNCGAKSKKPILKRWWFWVLAVLLLFTLVGSCSSPEASEDPAAPIANSDVSSSQSNDADKAEPQQTVYHVGDVLNDGDLQIVYMSSGIYKEENEFLQPVEGEKYIFLQFAFKNTSSENNVTPSFFNFTCYADGFAAEMYYGGEENLSATLSPGRVTSGYVYFSVPEDAKEIEIEYEPNIFLNDKIFFAFDGEKKSDYKIEPNLTATAGAYEVGSEVDVSDLKISYLSWEEFISDNMFVQPADGHWYISSEFLFENLGDSDVLISSFDFNCYADGIAMNSVHIRENDLNATISAGRKVQGTVTFEVPMDATVIEVEYITNYWTSDRVVFTIQ